MEFSCNCLGLIVLLRVGYLFILKLPLIRLSYCYAKINCPESQILYAANALFVNLPLQERKIQCPKTKFLSPSSEICISALLLSKYFMYLFCPLNFRVRCGKPFRAVICLLGPYSQLLDWKLTLINSETRIATAAATYAGMNSFLKLATIASTAASRKSTGISSIALELVPLMTTRRSASERFGRRDFSEESAVLMKTAPPIERPNTMPMNWASIMNL